MKPARLAYVPLIRCLDDASNVAMDRGDMATAARLKCAVRVLLRKNERAKHDETHAANTDAFCPLAMLTRLPSGVVVAPR